MLVGGVTAAVPCRCLLNAMDKFLNLLIALRSHHKVHWQAEYGTRDTIDINRRLNKFTPWEREVYSQGADLGSTKLFDKIVAAQTKVSVAVDLLVHLTPLWVEFRRRNGIRVNQSR